MSLLNENGRQFAPGVDAFKNGGAVKAVRIWLELEENPLRICYFIAHAMTKKEFVNSLDPATIDSVHLLNQLLCDLADCKE